MSNSTKGTINKLDIPETTIHHGSLIKKKQFLRKIYEEWYHGFIEATKLLTIAGQMLELGSGGGFLKELLPEIITSDILDLPDCDICCSAEDLPFDEYSLKAVFMLDVLHHIPDVRRFFAEMDRTLISGGMVYMIEPANTLFSSFIYKNFHHEDFDPNTPNWSFESIGPLSSSNQALPWIIFKRDRAIFEREYPALQIKKIELHTPLKYLLSGGLSFNTHIPGWSYGFFNFIEQLSRPVLPLMAMFQTIIIEKR